MNRTQPVNRGRRLLTLLAGLALTFTLVLPAQPAAASGSILGVTPTALTFATQQVLSTGNAQTVKLTLYPYTPYVVIRVEGDFIQENSCMRPTDTLSYPRTRICGVKVTFKPTTSGVRTGAIYAGTQRIAVLSGIGADLVEAAKTVQENSTLAQKMNATSPETAAAWANYTNVVDSGAGSAIASALQQQDQALLAAEKAELEAQVKQFEDAVQNLQGMMNTFGDQMTDLKQKLQEMLELTNQMESKIQI